MQRNSIQPRTVPTVPLLILFFLSGAAALVYEVLWLKELGRLFGVTAHAAAATLAVFFLGLAAGSRVWGARAARDPSPLRTYAFLEVGIAATAVAYFALLRLYEALYPVLFQAFGSGSTLFLVAKLLLTLVVLFPPSFLMGGTLPVMAQFLVRRSDRLGRIGTALYAVNTLGAATGALAAGFFLPRLLGFRASYATAIAINLAVAAIARFWSRGTALEPAAGDEPRSSIERRAPSRNLGASTVTTLAFASGFLTLALEVLWTRMFAQVLQNSVYTFAIILTVFLVALALGSGLAHLLCRRVWSPGTVLGVLLLLSGLSVGLSSLLFYRMTSGLDFLASSQGWTGYVTAIFLRTAVIVLPPGILIGSVFPFLLKLSEGSGEGPGRIVGRLASTNTAAAILGSLTAGFLMLDAFGLWRSIRILAAAYLLLALGVFWRVLEPRRRWTAVVPIVLLLIGLASPLDARFGLVTLEEGEEVVEVTEGAHGVVAVVRRGDDLRMKVDNSYLLGTSKSTPNLRLQSWIPLSLHPHPRSVFYLGMGTGITAGGALDFPLERVTVAELNPDVVRASKEHFEPWLNGLFTDPRVQVIADDGRAYLAGTDETFDLIISDIFLTYRVGVGSLYTSEHFETVAERLAPGGMFAQWLPAFELSRQEFGIIARTMLEVFPQVTLWRRSISPRFPVLALIGQMENKPLDWASLTHSLELLDAQPEAIDRLWFLGIPLAAYAGNLTRLGAAFEDYPSSTDDRPRIEYLSPIVNRQSWGSHETRVLAFSELAALLDEILQLAPPESDEFLGEVGEANRLQVRAGLALYKAQAARAADRPGDYEMYRSEYDRWIAEALSGEDSQDP